MSRFWKCFFFINALSISAVVAQDKLIPTTSTTLKTVTIPPSEGFVKEPVNTYMGVRIPPPEYVYKSEDYLHIVVETDDPNAACKDVHKKHGATVPFNTMIMACAEKTITKDNKYIACTTYLPRKGLVPDLKWGALYMHELAHCNWWKHD